MGGIQGTFGGAVNPTGATITVSRLWNNPTITTRVTDEVIKISMDVIDFKAALLREIGSVTLVFTKGELERRLDSAFAAVIRGMKEETVKVVQ